MAPAFRYCGANKSEYRPQADPDQREDAFGHGRMVSRYTPAF